LIDVLIISIKEKIVTRNGLADLWREGKHANYRGSPEVACPS